MDWTPADPLPDAFFEVARQIYAADPWWIPESEGEARALFSPAHSFFDQGGAAWIDVVPGRARLAGFVHPDARIEDQPAAYFGYWETAEDPALVQAQFARFEAWARGKGATRALGPINFRTHYAYRLRLNNFDRPPFYPGEPHQPAYYLKLLADLGYQQTGLYHSWFGHGPTILAGAQGLIERVQARAESHGMRFLPLTPDYWLENIESLHEDTRAIFGDNPGFSQISLDEFKRLLGPEKIAAIDPRCSVLTLGPDGRMVAFMLCFPDYGPLLRQEATPRLRPSELRFSEHFPLLRAPTLLGKTVGVMPKYRRLGLFEIMCVVSTKASLADYAQVATVMIRDGGLSASQAGKVFAAPGCRTHDYGLFGRVLTSDPT